jgi:hypothetical protein
MTASSVECPTRNPLWEGTNMLFLARNMWSRLVTIFSITLHMQFVRAIGLYEDGRFEGFPGFEIGRTMENFH